MSAIVQLICPICGAQKNNFTIFNCESCKFPYAFVEFFADENSKEHWKNTVNEYKEQYVKDTGNTVGDCISICRDSVSFFSSKKNEVVTLFGDGRKPEKKKDVVKFVSNDNNSAVIFRNGSVEVYGDNTYGQCNVSGVKNAEFIAISPTCVFVVDSQKNVHVFGSLSQKAKETVKKWTDVDNLIVSDSMIVSIDTSKRIQCVDLTDELSNVVRDIENWNNVKKICLHKSSCVALLEDGSIVMTPNNESYGEIKTWVDICDIVFDGTYVVGLSSNGDIKLSGKSKSTILDAGRKAVSSWKNIVSICSSNYAFGGYDKDGNLHLTGKFGGKVEQLVEEWSNTVNIK